MGNDNKNPFYSMLLPIVARASAMIAGILEKKDGELSQRGRLAWFLFVTVACSALCLLLIVRGIWGKALTPRDTGRVTTNSGVAPSAIRLELPSQKGYEETQKLAELLDSLKNDPSGSKTYHALIMARPGLLDSLGALQSYYQSKISTYGKEN